MQKLKSLTIAQMKSTLPPATAGQRTNTGKGEGEGFYLRMPEQTLQQLKVRAAQEKTTARMLVLSALKAAGYAVPAVELTDRRRSR